MDSIFVRNNNPKDGIDANFADRYNGIEYRFPAGELVECPIDAARHIFGYGAGDKTPFLVRLGWTRISSGGKDSVADGLARLDAFQFLQGRVVVEDAPQTTVEGELPPVEDDTTLHLPPSKRGKHRKGTRNLLDKAASLGTQPG